MLFNADVFVSLLKGANPTYGRFTTSEMQPIVNLLSKGCARNQLQKEINKITPDTATKYQSAIQAMANALGVHYFGIPTNRLSARFNGNFGMNFSTQSKPNGPVGSIDNPRYTTPTFHSTANVLCITPTNVKNRVGFIQICTARTQEYRFHGTNRLNGWRISAPFPISDSAGPLHTPFYVAGQVSHNCTHLTTDTTVSNGRPETLNLDLNDGFEDCGVWRYAETSDGVNENPLRLLKQIKRDQTFVAWVAVEIIKNIEYELIKRIDYRFDFEFNFDNAQNSVHRLTNRAAPPTISAVPPGTRLPPAALTATNMNAVDGFFYA